MLKKIHLGILKNWQHASTRHFNLAIVKKLQENFYSSAVSKISKKSIYDNSFWMLGSLVQFWEKKEHLGSL